MRRTAYHISYGLSKFEFLVFLDVSDDTVSFCLFDGCYHDCAVLCDDLCCRLAVSGIHIYHCLWSRPYVLSYYDARLSHCAVHVYIDDVSMNLEHVCKCVLRYIHKSEKRFALRQVWSFACERVSQGCTYHAFPVTLVDDNDHFSGFSADVRQERLSLLFLAA